MPRKPHKPRLLHRLSDAKIRAGIRNAPDIGKAMLNDGNGLYLQVSNKVPSWLHRYQIDTKIRAMGLGRYPEVGLGKARDLASDNRRLMRQGVDPLAQRQTEAQAELAAAAKQAPSFEACAEAYIAKQAKKWRNPKSRQQWEQSLRDYAYPTFGALPVDAIDGDLVIKALETVWEKHPVTAERTLIRIRKILAYAKSRKYRSGDNPAAWTDELEHVLPDPKELHTRKRFEALPYERIGEFMAKLRAYVPPHHSTVGDRGAAALELLILTSSRTNEVLGARKDEVDLAKRTWTRPASRMKSYKKPHTVTLSGSAMKLLEAAIAQNPESPFIFPGETATAPLAPGSLRLLMTRMGYAEFDVHGFRSSFRSWVQDCTNLDRIAAEIALAHRIGSVVEETYARGEMFAKRRVLAEAWDGYCNGVMGVMDETMVMFPAAAC